MGTKIWHHPHDPGGHRDEPPSNAERISMIAIWAICGVGIATQLFYAASQLWSALTPLASRLPFNFDLAALLFVITVTAAVFPCGRRHLSVASLVRTYRPRIADLDCERVLALLLDRNMRLIRELCIGRGDVETAEVDTRRLFDVAIRSGARRLVLLHNHPSGDSRPSRADTRVTAELARVAKTLRIDLTDHIIFGRGDGWTSFKLKGLL